MADAIHNREVATAQLMDRGLTREQAYCLLGRPKREIATALFDACSLLNDAGSCDDIESSLRKAHEILERVNAEWRSSR